MSKILIVGKTGSGKTTIAQKLAKGMETHVFRPHSPWPESNLTKQYQSLENMEELRLSFSPRCIVFEDLEKETTKHSLFSFFMQNSRNANANVIVVSQWVADIPPWARAQFDGVYVCGIMDTEKLGLGNIPPVFIDRHVKYYNSRPNSGLPYTA